jgi:hypothetical protein
VRRNPADDEHSLSNHFGSMKLLSVIFSGAFSAVLLFSVFTFGAEPTTQPTSIPCASCGTCGEHAVIPSGTTAIADHAFENCGSLKSVVIPASMVTIGVRAFAGTANLTNVTFDRSTSSMLKDLGDYAFYGSGITSLHLEASWGPNRGNPLLWGVYSFAECQNLVSAHIGGLVFYISDYAFYHSHKLSTVTFDSYHVGCWSVGTASFLGTSLTSFPLCPGILLQAVFAATPLQSWDLAQDYCAIVKQMENPPASGACSSCNTCGAHAVIPPGAIAIDDYAFMNCDTVQSIVIPSSVQVIGHSAFNGAKNLGSIVFQQTPAINFIGELAFANSGLRSFNLTGLGNNYIYMGRYSFAYAKQLRWVHLSGSFVQINDWQFYQSHALSSITFDPETWQCAYIGGNAFYNTSITALPICPRQYFLAGAVAATPIRNWNAATACASIGIVPTGMPTVKPWPTAMPTAAPTANSVPTFESGPTAAPIANSVPTESGPTAAPTESPTTDPTESPTTDPTESPTTEPTANPTKNPTSPPLADDVNAIRFAIGEHASVHAMAQSTKKSGKYVYTAIMSALAIWTPSSVPTVWPRAPPPAQFGPRLEELGFQLTSKSVQREDGDVAVWSSVPDHDHGHVQVYFDGTWYSDFRQEKLSPWRRLRGSSVAIYRYQGQ